MCTGFKVRFELCRIIALNKMAEVRKEDSFLREFKRNDFDIQPEKSVKLYSRRKSFRHILNRLMSPFIIKLISVDF